MAWVTNFAVSPRSGEPVGWGDVDYAGKTVRFEIPVRFDGHCCRVRLTNHYGSKPVKFKAALASEVKGDWISSLLSFESDEIPVGGEVVSKQEYCFLSPGRTVKLYIYFETDAEDCTRTFEAEWCSGKHFEQFFDKFVPEGTCALPLVASMDIDTPKGVYKKDDEFCVAAFGDSITQMRLWTDEAERRTVALTPGKASFVNLGIGGNRLLLDTNCLGGKLGQYFGRSGLERAEWELRGLRGTKRVLVALGVNDISQPDDNNEFAPPIEERKHAPELIEGFSKLERLIESLGAECVFCTVTPFGGMPVYCEETETARRQLNDWFRTRKHIDFAAAVEDPEKPGFMRPEYDSGDHLHPSPEGGLAMAAAIPDEYLMCEGVEGMD